MRSIMRSRGRSKTLAALTIATATGVTLALATPAFAHVTANLYGATATSGGYGTAFFRVPHGCDGDATNAVSITMPEGVSAAAVKPQAKAGWKVSRGADGVTWSNGSLQDQEFDDFGLNLKWPTLSEGETSRKIYFKTVQTCAAEVSLKVTQGSTTVTGAFPEYAGEEVSIFAGDRRLGRAKLGLAGELQFTTAAERIPSGTEVTVRRGGKVLGNSTTRTEAWIAVPGDGNDPSMPAPSVTVMAGTAGH